MWVFGIENNCPFKAFQIIIPLHLKLMAIQHFLMSLVVQYNICDPKQLIMQAVAEMFVISSTQCSDNIALLLVTPYPLHVDGPISTLKCLSAS